jgi:ubiquinone/menaquinone biosynthesis C-methylase UbiE
MRTHAVRHRSRPASLLLLLWVVAYCASCTQIRRCSYEPAGRDGWQQPERVIETLELEPGQAVADLGSGSGYFVLPLARAVGPAGNVYAVDVDADMNEVVAERAREANLTNVTTVLAGADDARLAESSVDLLFTSNTYHHLPDRIEYFRRLRPALRPGARVAIIEYRKQGWWLRSHATPPDAIQDEMEQAGFRLVADHDFLERQSFQVFVPTSEP